MAKPTTDNRKITALLADVAEVLLRHNASTLDVLTLGRQLTVSAFGQIVGDAPGSWPTASPPRSAAHCSPSRQTGRKNSRRRRKDRMTKET